jgi:hypothetical protein
MTNFKLIDEINKETFNPELFEGYIYNEVNFIKYFYFFENSITDVFKQINMFLVSNGYNPLDFENKSLYKKDDVMQKLNKELQEVLQKFERTIQRKFELEELLKNYRISICYLTQSLSKNFAKRKLKPYWENASL